MIESSRIMQGCALLIVTLIYILNGIEKEALVRDGTNFALLNVKL